MSISTRSTIQQFATLSAGALIAAAFAAGAARAAEPTETELVDALNQLFGKHAGARASHAKGFCAKGAFVPSPEARTLARSNLFAAGSVPATVRFSIGGGNPAAPDKSRSVRGIAVRLADKSETHDLVLISEPVFFAATPASFLSFLKARVPNPETKKPDAARIEEHNQKFPEGKAQPAMLAGHAAPFSYATTPYFSNHAFKFTNAAGASKWARVELQPAAGTRHLTADEEKSLPDAFLEDEFKARVAGKPVEFGVFAHLQGPNDSLINPAEAWSKDSPRVRLGTLSIDRHDGQACDAEVYVPTNLASGIEASDDPVLKVRAAAYAISKGRRSN